MEEDIYGGVGDVDEDVYDTAGGQRKEMDHSKEGIYDNPLMKRAPREVIKQKPKDKMEEAIYGEREDVSGGDELYEDPKLAGAKNIQYTETGIYDNPENVKPPGTVLSF